MNVRIQARIAAALNTDPQAGPIAPPRSVEIGVTFAEALALLKKARHVAVRVWHSPGTNRCSSIRIPRSAMLRWLKTRIDADDGAGARPLHSMLTHDHDGEELCLFVGAPGSAVDGGQAA